jgi:uncharacterized alpha-E superfamily protein
MNTDRLFWLGRYSERVYTTLKLFSSSFDTLIEQREDDHRVFCESLEIPDIYRDKDDFIARYPFGLDDPNSIISNLYRAYDNAIELREEIGSETLSFIQMAIYEMKSAMRSEAPLLHFQKITDAILAFWGCADDQIEDENTRNIIKIGKRVERIDLYARLRRDRAVIRREIRRLSWRISRTELIYSEAGLQRLQELADAPELDYLEIIRIVDALVEC